MDFSRFSSAPPASSCALLDERERVLLGLSGALGPSDAPLYTCSAWPTLCLHLRCSTSLHMDLMWTHSRPCIRLPRPFPAITRRTFASSSRTSERTSRSLAAGTLSPMEMVHPKLAVPSPTAGACARIEAHFWGRVSDRERKALYSVSCRSGSCHAASRNRFRSHRYPYADHRCGISKRHKPLHEHAFTPLCPPSPSSPPSPPSPPPPRRPPPSPPCTGIQCEFPKWLQNTDASFWGMWGRAWGHRDPHSSGCWSRYGEAATFFEETLLGKTCHRNWLLGELGGQDESTRRRVAYERPVVSTLTAAACGTNWGAGRPPDVLELSCAGCIVLRKEILQMPLPCLAHWRYIGGSHVPRALSGTDGLRRDHQRGVQPPPARRPVGRGRPQLEDCEQVQGRTSQRAPATERLAAMGHAPHASMDVQPCAYTCSPSLRSLYIPAAKLFGPAARSASARLVRCAPASRYPQVSKPTMGDVCSLGEATPHSCLLPTLAGVAMQWSLVCEVSVAQWWHPPHTHPPAHTH